MQISKMSHCVVVDPAVESAPAIVMFGGLYGWEGQWFVERIPAALKSEMIFVLPNHYTTDCSDCLNDLKSKIDDSKISSFSLCGYSRGGIEVAHYIDLKPWKILGLIDPSAPTMGGYAEEVFDKVKSKIRCMYNLGNWSSADYYPKIQSFHDHLLAIKADMTDAAHLHKNMPKFFLEKYGSDFK